MNALPKVLVVDDGERSPDHALSAELAELGYPSVTAPLEATEDVLGTIPLPTAIVLQLPHPRERARYQRFLDLASRLKARLAGIPVILVEQPAARVAGAYSALLQSAFTAHAVSRPEL
ncbi:MAG TPA: hypothetical protein VM434_08880 [Beijerinckiaceae bacterium]|nr:hypothetical protein [Beijerinckiaceae bacterium]